MAFCRHGLLILCALILGGQICDASTREERAYAAAALSFQTEMWSRAEAAFGQFAQRYPKSTNAPMAVLLEAQAHFKQGKFTNVIALLDGRKDRADGLADQYVSWIGEAQIAGSNYLAAAGTFTSLTTNFPESPLRLRAAIEAASAYDQAEDWQQVIDFLSQTNGVFQQKADLDPENELVSSGRLLMARALLMQKEYANSKEVLSALNPKPLKPEQDAQRNQIDYGDSMAVNDIPDALQDTTNLLNIARQEKASALAADTWAKQAAALTTSNQRAQAMAAWGENLTADAPAENQREAILNMAALAAGLKQFSDAEQWLETYLKQFPDAPGADIALLADGELHLNNYTLQAATNNTGAATNDLPAAQGQFDVLLSKYPASAYAGKAYLDRGWCKYFANNFSDGLADFEKAVQKGLSPVDLAVAKFKAGDILFAQTNFAGALENYRSVFPEVVPDEASGRPSAERDLRGRALYQCLRACLGLNDLDGAAEAFTKLSQTISSDELGQSGALLYGESLAKPEDARTLFEKLAPRFTGSPLEPDLKLAIARTYEQEQDWAAAITNYEGWIRDFPTNSLLRPQVDYALAQANYEAGDEGGALARFTYFVAQYPTNELAPRAQWWVAEHFFREGEYDGAETNYEAVFQNPAWKNSPLYYPAQLMAGNAAMNRLGYKEAAGYFLALINDTNCPDADDNVWVKARFAYGAALMEMDSSDTSATLANLQTATNTFIQIVQKYPTNELGAQAEGEIGDCALQLGDYVSATNAYAQVFGTNSPAGISARSEAQVGFGMVLEKMAAQATGAGQTNFLSQALDNYMAVFNAGNQRDDETADAFWVKEAGLKAAPLVGLFYGGAAQKKFYDSLQTNLPALAETIQKKIAALPPEKN